MLSAVSLGKLNSAISYLRGNRHRSPVEDTVKPVGPVSVKPSQRSWRIFEQKRGQPRHTVTHSNERKGALRQCVLADKTRTDDEAANTSRSLIMKAATLRLAPRVPSQSKDLKVWHRKSLRIILGFDNE